MDIFLLFLVRDSNVSRNGCWLVLKDVVGEDGVGTVDAVDEVFEVFEVVVVLVVVVAEVVVVVEVEVVLSVA